MKRFKLLKWTGIGVAALVVILLVVNTILVLVTDSRFEKRLAALRAEGDPVSIDDLLASEPIDPEQDAAVYVRRAEEGVQAIRGKLDVLFDSETFKRGRPTEDELKQIQSAFEAHPDVIPLLKQAAACPEYVPLFSMGERAKIGSPADPGQFLAVIVPRVGMPREAARTLANWSLSLRMQGRRDEALEACRTLLQLSRHFEHEPSTVSYLATCACRGYAVQEASRVLQSGPVSDDARETLEKELALHEGVEGYRRALKTERACGVGLFGTFPLANSWLGRGMWSRERNAYLDVIERFLSEADRPFHELPGDNAKTGGRLADLLLPSLQSTRRSMEGSRARLRSLRVLNALGRREGPGKMPKADLSDLGLPNRATTDPFTGNPLLVKKLPDGWLIYSVGKNLEDDGGQIEEEEDVGVGPIAP